MANAHPRVTIHMVASLDGMIARKDNSISWFDTADYYDKGGPAPDAAQFLKEIDCYIMGARTYEHALELSPVYGWAYGDTQTIVLSHRQLRIERPNIEIYGGDLGKLVKDKLRCGNAWVVGGAATAKNFIEAKLADEIRMSVLPVILGDGIPFFDHIGREYALHLKDVAALQSGMVELCYEILK